MKSLNRVSDACMSIYSYITFFLCEKQQVY